MKSLTLDTSLYCDPGRQDSLSAAATPEVLAFGARTSCPSTVACSQKVVAQRVHPNSLTATGHVMIEAIHLGCRTPVTAMLLTPRNGHLGLMMSQVRAL